MNKETEMTVKSRKSKIDNLVPKVVILLRKQGQATQFDMPGSDDCDKYHVSIGNVEMKQVEGVKYAEYPVVCNCKNLDGSQPCKGNSNGTVCYHSLAALKKRAEPDKKIAYCDDFLSAVNLLNFGGKLIKVVSKQGEGIVWGVVR